MGGVIMSHLIVLGVQVKGDGGQLFIYAVVVLICSLAAIWLSRGAWPTFIKRLLLLGKN
jgi:hypothetical protein